MTIVLLVTALAALFIVIAACEPVAARLRLPYTVVLAVVGAALGTLALWLQRSGVAATFPPEVAELLSLPIRSSVFLFMFLPTLLFQVSLSLNIRRMIDDWVPILVMAVVAVLVSTLAIGFALQPFSSMSLAACLLLGAIVSTTDPSAVVSIFRSIAAPQRLTRIVEGESLLNDAAAIALFGFFLTFVMAGVPDPTLRDAVVQFPLLIVGGVALGYGMARVALSLMTRMASYPTAQLSLSLALPYLTYVLAEQGLQVSGVIAVVTAGIAMNLAGPGRLSPATWKLLSDTWEMLSHWAGSLIFIVAALLIPRLIGRATEWDLVLIGVVALAAIVARAVMLSGLLPLLTRLNLSPKVERPYRVAILWGGLRGAVTLALALAVTENPMVPPHVKREVGILATGFVLFTLMAQGTTLRWVIRRLGLARLTPLDLALSNQVIAVALQNVREEVAATVRERELDPQIVRAEAKSFGQRLTRAVELADDSADDIPDRDRITLGLLALAGRERDAILASFRQQIIPPRLAEAMLVDVDRLIERTRLQGRDGYRSAGRLALGYGRRHRVAVWAHNRLKISRWLSQLTSDRFEMLLTQRLILGDLHKLIDGKIRRIHGRRVAEILHEMLKRREDETEQALEALRLQYPGYSGEMVRSFIRRTALQLELREYETLRDDGLIGQELFMTLRQRIQIARGKKERRPRLDFALQKSELVRQFPLFAEMEEDQLRVLERLLQTVYVRPGDVLLRRGDVPRKVFFIASGAVESDVAGQKVRLGRGEMFGQLAILTRKARRAQVTAISHGTLLSLDETRFLELLRRNKALQQAAVDSAARRNVTIDLSAT
ncbi:cation:proton antiporter [Cereibacter azotoformans]|uniref:Sodium/proton antiporter (CPA1 family) n=2 Tax=Cereibacter TaxID=1653176 RepID=A0A2T5KBW2_9RHOB|nr:cation:proton antiporter [Cereibacter azotoformans]AXQ94226.1 sodium:proton antiporter [Cereibacter sphaeroides]MBO4167962.1 cation:proton antiporter [Cereibacter azotoformans]PTR19894.1 sodium/proton antiporter (CPA1 family) [Cereibacter azotoformans]UIJ29767.1 cation:proton antiporter [Cereibacter azotoformans]ULB10454.1 cation:proton antiporter [Cereibacter azotoformans]